MTTVKVSVEVNANADLVFSNLGDFAGFQPKFVVAKKITGSGIGCLREMTMANGAKVVERCDNHDANSRTLTYSIVGNDHPMPFRAYVATVAVTPTRGNACRVDWFSNFEVISGTEEEAVKFLTSGYKGFIRDVQTLLAA
ncbi:MAG: SRPBCC family protein [Alphaproteobacteria bacterium]|nr:SRPBCC family protein [Alphaproteobacteria bacterium]